MSYAYTHLKHKTITNNINSMHLYYELIQVLLLITGLRLFKYPVGVTDLILMQKLILITDLCLFRTLVGVHRAYAHTEVPLGTTMLILILRSLHLFEGTRRYNRGITERILVLRNLDMYFRSYTCLTERILILRILYWYYRTWTCI